MSIALGVQLQALGFRVGWGKPLASAEAIGYATDKHDTDLNFVPHILALAPEQCLPTLFSLDKHAFIEQLRESSPQNFTDALAHYWDQAAGDILLLEGPSTLEEGEILNLSLPEITSALDASVLIVARFNTRYMIDQLIAAQKRLGTALLGVILNGVGPDEANLAAETVVPYLEKQGIPVLATLPKISFLSSIRVSELVSHLDAEILCCDDHLDLVVESLKIGAMNVNAALRFFGQGMHQAVVTGGDRRDLQIAALETSTHCLILTGQISPSKDVIALAHDKEVPILAVPTDTLTTVELIDSLFGHIPLRNPDKVPLIKEVLAKEIDMTRLASLMGLEMPVIVPHS